MTTQTGMVGDRRKARTSMARWQDIDLAQRALGVAIACCQHAGLAHIAERLLVVQRDVQQERDRV